MLLPEYWFPSSPGLTDLWHPEPEPTQEEELDGSLLWASALEGIREEHRRDNLPGC